MTLLGEMLSGTRLNHAAMALMVAGLVLKSALFPLHFWLPQAHAMAPAPVSALLSALVVKAAYMILLRLWFEVFPLLTLSGRPPARRSAAAAIVWGSLMALRQERLKLLIAYSTVAQIGYLFLVFPLARGETMAGRLGRRGTVDDGSCLRQGRHVPGGRHHPHTAGSDRISRWPVPADPSGYRWWCSPSPRPPSSVCRRAVVSLPSGCSSTPPWHRSVVVSAGYPCGTLLAAAYIARVLGWAFLDVKRSSYPVIPWVMKWPPLALSLHRPAVRPDRL
jgi:multicomponent Na+:H+ antiporter subunit D